MHCCCAVAVFMSLLLLCWRYVTATPSENNNNNNHVFTLVQIRDVYVFASTLLFVAITSKRAQLSMWGKHHCHSEDRTFKQRRLTSCPASVTVLNKWMVLKPTVTCSAPPPTLRMTLKRLCLKVLSSEWEWCSPHMLNCVLAEATTMNTITAAKLHLSGLRSVRTVCCIAAPRIRSGSVPKHILQAIFYFP